MILDLEGPDGLLQLTFCSEEGGRAALHTEALLLPVFPLLAKLQLLSSGLFPVLKALKRWWGPALLVGSTIENTYLECFLLMFYPHYQGSEKL